jgi:hypothetical protein
VPPRPAHLPDALVRLAPVLLQELKQLAYQAQVCLSKRMPACLASVIASMTSPYTSSWRWSTAALPIRTGAEFSYPGSQVASHSASRRSPATPYMIWTSRALPATARSSHSRQALASAV